MLFVASPDNIRDSEIIQQERMQLYNALQQFDEIRYFRSSHGLTKYYKGVENGCTVFHSLLQPASLDWDVECLQPLRIS